MAISSMMSHAAWAMDLSWMRSESSLLTMMLSTPFQPRTDQTTDPTIARWHASRVPCSTCQVSDDFEFDKIQGSPIPVCLIYFTSWRWKTINLIRACFRIRKDIWRLIGKCHLRGQGQKVRVEAIKQASPLLRLSGTRWHRVIRLQIKR